MITIISYRPLWETMEKNGITQYRLLKSGIDNRVNITAGIIKNTNVKHNKNITVLTLEKLCNILECTPDSIIEFIPNEKIE